MVSIASRLDTEATPPRPGHKAAALFDSLVGNHALVDGNKRLGWPAVVVFYSLNGVDLDVPADPAYELVMSVARRESSVDVEPVETRSPHQ